MDTYEATKLVMSRIQTLDPENASKIMGYVLIQDQGENEMIRLAFVPDSLLLSYINHAKARLGLLSNTPNPNLNPNPKNHFRQTPPRLSIPRNGVQNGFHFSNPSSPASPFQRPGPDPTPDPARSLHRRSCSVNDAEEVGGWRPCMYFARGFCKNGSSCKFVHGDGSEAAMDGFDEMVRLKALHHHRLAFMASPTNHHPLLDFVNEHPSARQIYLTFPADSTFKEEDVSNYFNMFGPVHDVRIPYQQKRMFGFVTFIYPETVKLILAKENPHFVCDSRVLVKPYKEKGKVLEKKQLQNHLDLSPRGIDLDSREQIELPPFGSKMLQEMMIRRKLEQEAELQHAIELQGRRMMNLQLMDLKNQPQHNHLHLQSFRAGVPISSPRQSQLGINQSFVAATDGMNLENLQEFDSIQEADKFSGIDDGGQSSSNINDSCNKLQNVNDDDSELPESFLPDNLFASPTKVAAEHKSLFSASTYNNIPVKITFSNNTVPATPNGSLKSCLTQIPRLSSGQEAIEM